MTRGTILNQTHTKELTAQVAVQIVDDHPVLRLGLRTLLERDSRYKVVAECGDSSCCIHCLQLAKPDLLLMDITLPGGMDGLQLIKQVTALSPGVPILVLSVHDERLYAARVLAAGAMGYLMKDAPPPDLLRAIRQILDGAVSVSPAMAQRLVQRAVHGNRAPLDPSCSLSDRELEVLFHVGKGFSSAQIAESLHISVKTVETHRAKLRRKLSLHSGAELLRYAVAWRHAEGRRLFAD